MRAIIIAILLTSCSAEWHFEQACKKKPIYCLDTQTWDTFFVRDTFEYHFVDTTEMIDTIYIDTGGISVKIIRERDVIRTTIKSKPDTTFITKTFTPPPRIIYRRDWWWLILIPLLLWLIYKK